MCRARPHVRGAAVMAVVEVRRLRARHVPARRPRRAGGGAGLARRGADRGRAGAAPGRVHRPGAVPAAAPDAAHEEAIAAGIDLSAGSAGLVGQIAAAASRAGRPARLHLKADTGMSRGGATAADWPAVVRAARAARPPGWSRSPGSGRTWRARTCPATRPSRRSSRRSARRWRRPSGPARGPRCGTWPTPRPR